MKCFSRSVTVLSLLTTAGAYVPGSARSSFGIVFQPRSSSVKNNALDNTKINGAPAVVYMSGDSSVQATTPATDFLKELLTGLATGNGGQKLLAASSASWREAIFQAVGAPETADESIVAKALQDAMSKSENQFAILMGQAEPFVATFPSDVVDYNDDGTAWVECRLRQADTDELLVTMGIVVQQTDDGSWLISSLDWQDFRDDFYPGLSGREWLRSF